MSYELFWYPGTCARVPLVGLEEIGIPYRPVLVDRFGGTDQSFLRVNPKGKVPTLVADGVAITENPAIQIFLARRHPEAALLPAGSLQIDTEVLQLSSWFAAGVHPCITRFRFPESATRQESDLESIRAVALTQLRESFAIIEARLRDREWLFDSWSLVDVHLLWLWFRATGSGMDSREFPCCSSHARRCEQRPSVAAILDLEEREFARLKSAGRIPVGLRSFQAGRCPPVGRIPDAIAGGQGPVPG